MLSTNTQIKILTGMVKLLLDAMEEQTLAVEELKKEHATQIEVLTKIFTQQIETLKGRVAEMTEKIETQLSNTQKSLSASPSYAEITVHHQAVDQAIYELSPQWAQHHHATATTRS